MLTKLGKLLKRLAALLDCQIERLECLKAAPRFELGIGILQTPALPLGYAAVL